MRRLAEGRAAHIEAIRTSPWWRLGGPVRRLERVVDQIDRAISRLTVAMVVSALIVGSSIVMMVKGGPTLFGLPAFGLLGYLAAGFGAVWLTWSVLRSGRGERRPD